MKTQEDLDASGMKEMIIREICKSAPDYKYLYLKLKYFIDIKRKGESLFKAAALAVGRPISKIKSSSQKQEDVLGRALIYFELKKQLGTSFKEIGRTFNRDHVTVINSYYNVENGLSVGDEYYTIPYKKFCRYLGR